MNSHEEICYGCGASIAEWGGGMNFQHKEEWRCNGTKRRKIPKGVTITVKGRKWKHNYNHPCGRIFCGACARKRHYKCGRHGCHGNLRLERRLDGSLPKKRAA